MERGLASQVDCESNQRQRKGDDRGGPAVVSPSRRRGTEPSVKIVGCEGSCTEDDRTEQQAYLSDESKGKVPLMQDAVRIEHLADDSILSRYF